MNFQFFIILALFTTTHILFDTHHPLLRLLIIPLLLILQMCKRDHEVFRELFTKKIFQRVIFTLTILLCCARLLHFVHRLKKPLGFREDIAIVHEKAREEFFIHIRNPYSSPIDSYTVGKSDGSVEVFSGFKYPPLQIFYYAPFVLSFGPKGIYGGNFVIYLGICLALFGFLRRFSLLYGALGVLLYLSADFNFTLAFNNGTNDFLPIFFILVALQFFQPWPQSQSQQTHLSSKVAIFGLLWGLSLLSKQLPVGLFCLWALTQGRKKEVALAIMVGFLGTLPFLISDGSSFIRNVIEFNLTRPVRETSILVDFPPLLQKIVPLLGLIATIFLAWKGRKNPLWNLRHSWSLPMWGLIIFLLTSKMTPPHYFVWVLPFFILWILTPTPELKGTLS